MTPDGRQRTNEYNVCRLFLFLQVLWRRIGAYVVHETAYRRDHVIIVHFAGPPNGSAWAVTDFPSPFITPSLFNRRVSTPTTSSPVVRTRTGVKSRAHAHAPSAVNRDTAGIVCSICVYTILIVSFSQSRARCSVHAHRCRIRIIYFSPNSVCRETADPQTASFPRAALPSEIPDRAFFYRKIRTANRE